MSKLEVMSPTITSKEIVDDVYEKRELIPKVTSKSSEELMKKLNMFKTSLERDLNQEVEWASEHLTSEDAKEKLKLQRQEGILSRKIMKGQIDSMAATIFLQDWMNQR